MVDEEAILVQVPGMCRRFTLIASKSELFSRFQAKIPPSYNPRYNISSGQQILVIRPDGVLLTTSYVMWGFEIGRQNNLLLNARAETLAGRPLFLPLLSTGRCLIPASGWFTWRKEGEYNIPFYVQPRSHEVFCLAGLVRVTKTGREAVVLTTHAEGETASDTGRVPVVLSRDAESPYLAGADILGLPGYPFDLLQVNEVSRKVNDPNEDGVDLIQPLHRSPEMVQSTVKAGTRKRVLIDRMEKSPAEWYPGGLTIYTDGAARKNPGPAACAFLLLDRNGQFVGEYAAFIGLATNNTAEYTAVERALLRAKDHSRTSIDLYSDSQLVVRQLTGRYQVTKSHLALSISKIRELERNFQKVTYHEVPRENRHIQHCDKLCNYALDECINDH